MSCRILETYTNAVDFTSGEQRGMDKDEEFTVVGFNPKTSFNNARSGVQYIQLIWDGNCSDLIQHCPRTLGKHRASWPDSAEV
jgi:hypothetical protein